MTCNALITLFPMYYIVRASTLYIVYVLSTLMKTGEKRPPSSLMELIWLTDADRSHPRHQQQLVPGG